MQEQIREWVASCAHCVSYNAWRTRFSELHFSWPVTVPFWIIHLDLWSPWYTETDKGTKIHLLNRMCDLTQFVVSSITHGIEAVALA